MLLQIEQQLSQSLSGMDKIKNELLAFAPKIAGALILFLIGNWLIKRVARMVQNIFVKRNFDPSLQSFLSSLIRVGLMILLLISVAGIIGVNITGFAALLAGAGLAIGSALNGSLGNLAGGVMILIFKPFKVKDFIEAQGTTGEVSEIGIFSTTITTPERKKVIVPNGALSTGIITNYSISDSLRVDIPIAISPSVSIEKARKVAIEAMLQHQLVLQTPSPEVVVTKIADGMVTLQLRPSALQPDYPTVFVEVQEMVKNAFDAYGIDGPVPHRVIIQK